MWIHCNIPGALSIYMGSSSCKIMLHTLPYAIYTPRHGQFILPGPSNIPGAFTGATLQILDGAREIRLRHHMQFLGLDPGVHQDRDWIPRGSRAETVATSCLVLKYVHSDFRTVQLNGLSLLHRGKI